MYKVCFFFTRVSSFLVSLEFFSYMWIILKQEIDNLLIFQRLVVLFCWRKKMALLLENKSHVYQFFFPFNKDKSLARLIYTSLVGIGSNTRSESQMIYMVLDSSTVLLHWLQGSVCLLLYPSATEIFFCIISQIISLEFLLMRMLIITLLLLTLFLLHWDWSEMKWYWRR